jgi:hypothetical protein
MVNAILSLVTNSLISGFAIIGIGTFINKVGKFFKVIEESSNDGYKKGFDAIMIDSMDEMNRCVESINLITINFNKIIITIYDIVIGNKYIKKDKDGKIIICNKSKVYSGFKDKIEELSTKVKRYENELKKFKSSNNSDETENKLNNDDDDKKSLISEDTYSSVSEDSDSDSSIDESKNDKPISSGEKKKTIAKNIKINTSKQLSTKNSSTASTTKNIESDDDNDSNEDNELNNDEEFYLESDEK